MQRTGRLQHVAASFRRVVLVASPKHAFLPRHSLLLPLRVSNRYASGRAASLPTARPPPSYQNSRRLPNKQQNAPVEEAESKELKHGPVLEEGEKKIPLNSLPKRQITGWFIAWTIAGGIGFHCMSLYSSFKESSDNPKITELSEQKDVAARYDDTADSFDGEVALQEWIMGINTLRQRLSWQCKGHVLEVSCGTGRNVGYFNTGIDGKVDSLTFVDLSPEMIEVCKKKWDALQSNHLKSWNPFAKPLKQDLPVRFLCVSALGTMPLAPTDYPKKYDTIIQTMGLCSTAAPVQLLTNMAQYLDTKNPEARILLMEHGRSYRAWLNNILDSSAEKHAEIHGCWFNRDIGALVADAADKAGLEISKEKRKHFGTTWLFELKPKVGFVPSVASTPVEDSDVVGSEPQMKESRGWFSWFNAK